MQQVSVNHPLINHNTFKIDAVAKWFINIKSVDSLITFARNNEKIYNSPKFILGGGSNLLFTKDYSGLMIFPTFDNISVEEGSNCVHITAGAGIVWDDLVSWCVERSYHGIENLSLIPGHVGAAPIQNIGAYGVEAKDVIHNVEVIDLDTFDLINLDNKDCKFAYRDSIFKHSYKNKYMVTQVTFKLSKSRNFNLEYGNLKEEVEGMGEVNIKNIRESVIKIRESKLPDPDNIGNAGSFFKNPIIDNHLLKKIKENYPNIPTYSVDDKSTKVAAGWLIDQCGWKGKTYKNAGVHEKQALVLINKGNATGNEIAELAKKIKESVFEKFQISLDPEVLYL